MSSVYLGGVGMVRFGKHPIDVGFEQLAAGASIAALKDAGASRSQIEALYVGHVFGGPVAGQRVAAQVGIDGLPVSHHENYCASGATALREAGMAIRAGLYDVGLVIGAEKMTDRVKGGVAPDPSDLDAVHGFVMTAGHAMSARRYMLDHGATREQIAMVAVKNHAHSRHNPFAHYQHAIDFFHKEGVPQQEGLQLSFLGVLALEEGRREESGARGSARAHRRGLSARASPPAQRGGVAGSMASETGSLP